MWRATAEVLGHPEWPEDPRFTTGTDRMRNRSELIELIETVLQHALVSDLKDASGGRPRGDGRL